MTKKLLTGAIALALGLALACSEPGPTPDDRLAPPAAPDADGLDGYLALDDIGRVVGETDGPIIIIRPGLIKPTEVQVDVEFVRQEPTAPSVIANGCVLRRDFFGDAVTLFDMYTTRAVKIDGLSMSSDTFEIEVQETGDGFQWRFRTVDGEWCDAVPGPVTSGQVPIEFAGVKTRSLRGDGARGLASRLQATIP